MINNSPLPYQQNGDVYSVPVTPSQAAPKPAPAPAPAPAPVVEVVAPAPAGVSYTTLFIIAAVGVGVYWAYSHGYFDELIAKVKEHIPS